MKIVADLHLHSKYSRAVSRQMDLPYMTKWASKKGIDLLGTGDFTHPLWFRELESKLEEAAAGIYSLKGSTLQSVKFLLTSEISSIYSQGGRLRRIHNIIMAPSFSTVRKINQELTKRGANLLSDGRPILGLSSIQLAELIWSLNEDCLIIPAHAWTPWFSLYGSKSGFDSINECFGSYAKRIYAVETGLSSDPAMNWRIKELQNRSIVSFSDAHSPAKLSREATVFQLKDNFSYKDFYLAIQKTRKTQRTRTSEKPENQKSDLSGKSESSEFSENRILYTIEFHPEEGKYHYTGHRTCGIIQSPQETKKNGLSCPVCGKPLTIGVMHRVEELADLPANIFSVKQTASGLTAYFHQNDFSRPPYIMLVPLLEILAEALEGNTASPKVIKAYENLVVNFHSELTVLTKTPLAEIELAAERRVAESIAKVRRGEVVIKPGYDGVFGLVKIRPGNKEEKSALAKEQMSLF